MLRNRNAALLELLRRQPSQRHADRQVEFRRGGQLHAVSVFSLMIFDADQILPALLFQTGKVVVRLVIAIRQHDHGVGDHGAHRHLTQRPGFVLCMLFLYDHIGINAVFKVKKCVDMEQIPAVLTLRSRPIGVLIRRVRAGFQRRTVHGQQSVAPELLLRTQMIREAVKQIFERGWKQLLPLLHKGRRRRRVDPPAEMPEQPLPDALFAHGENEMDQHSGRQRPFSGKIPTRLPRVPLRLFHEPSDDGKEPLPQYHYRFFHVQPP